MLYSNESMGGVSDEDAEDFSDDEEPIPRASRCNYFGFRKKLIFGPASACASCSENSQTNTAGWPDPEPHAQSYRHDPLSGF